VDKGQGSRPRKDTGTYEARQRVGEGKVTSDRPNRRIPAWRVTNVPDDVSPVDGTVGVLYHDRSYDPTRNTYDTTLSESPAGGTSFASAKVSTASSHPCESLFFRAGTDAPGFVNCAVFHGDYIGLTYGSDGNANLVWTDMRDPDAASGLYLQFVYFARR